jgi:hypothetical protein
MKLSSSTTKYSFKNKAEINNQIYIYIILTIWIIPVTQEYFKNINPKEEEKPLKFNGEWFLSYLHSYPLSSIPSYLSYIYLLSSFLMHSFSTPSN